MSADRRGHPRRRQPRPVRRQARLPPDADRVSHGHRARCARPDTQARQTALSRHLSLYVRSEPRDGDALRVNCLAIEITDPKGTIAYNNSFVAELAVDRDNVAARAACGRARWKVENETFNTRKTKGYSLEPNFGHGKENLGPVPAILDLLAFACHTVADLAGRHPWRKARASAHTRIGFFNHLL
jgi:hypothetical protein